MFPESCRLCRTPLPTAARFCPRCGQRKRPMRRRSGWRLLFVLAMAGVCAGVWVVPHRVRRFERVEDADQQAASSVQISTYNPPYSPPMLPRTPSHYTYSR